jgi:hypothetical protein
MSKAPAEMLGLLLFVGEGIMVTKNWDHDDDKLVAWGYARILVETRGFLLNGRNGRRFPQKTRGPALQKSA